MNREKFAWLVSIVLIAMLALHLPGSFVRRDDDYNFVRTLIDIHREVSANYVEPVDEDKLSQGAIDGMLGNARSVYRLCSARKEGRLRPFAGGKFQGSRHPARPVRER